MAVSYFNLETATTIHRDVMDMLYQVYHVDRPFGDSIEEQGADSNYTEWAEDNVAAPRTGGGRVDGSDSTGNDATSGAVVGNRIQIDTRIVRISDGSQAVNSVGNIGTLAHQIGQRQIEVYRDIEASSLTEDGSVADDGNTTAGRSAGFFAWIQTNFRTGTGTTGGFSNGTVASYTPGTARALSMGEVRGVVDDIFKQGREPDCLVVIPDLKTKISEFLFSSSARVSTLFADTGNNATDATAQGSIGVYHTDHGTLELKSNPIMQEAAADRTHVGIYNSSYWATGFLDGPVTRPLARTGLADNREVIAYWTLKCLNERASGAVFDINPTLAVTT